MACPLGRHPVRLEPSPHQNPGKIPIDWTLDTSQVLGGHVVRQEKCIAGLQKALELHNGLTTIRGEKWEPINI